jgi:sulfur-oxidizing protein SoxX
LRLAKNLLIKVVLNGLVITSAFSDISNDMLVKEGAKIFNAKKIGNCLACHDVNGKDILNPGSLGPKLKYLSLWPEKALYDKIYDPYTTNPTSIMPPFGRNGWLTDHQIKALVAFLKTVN